MVLQKLFVGLLLLACGQLLWAAEPVMVPTPRASVVASKAGNQPFLAAARSQQPVDLGTRGYSEVELLVRGYYGANQPYVTRVLVRRPQEAGKFSGRVIVELLHELAPYESAPCGDSPGALPAPWRCMGGRDRVARRLSPCSRPESRAIQVAGPCCRPGRELLPSGNSRLLPGCGCTGGGVAAQLQQGKSAAGSESAAPGAAGYSASGDYVATFATAVHRELRLGDESPVFDGYLNVSGIVPGSPACAAALPGDVPFVSVLTDGASGSTPATGDAVEAGGESFRVYEVAGVEGAGLRAAGAPAAADIANAGPIGQARCREPIMDLMLSYSINAAWQQLDDLLVLKRPMVSLPRLEIDAGGNTVGGWRLPQVDLPLAGRVAGRRPRQRTGQCRCAAALRCGNRLDATLRCGDTQAALPHPQ